MGLKFIAVMPEGVTRERVITIRAYGGSVSFVPKSAGMRGAIKHAEELAAQHHGFATKQFENPDNCEAHRVWTGQEVLAQIPGGVVDAVVSGVGTGGTITGLYQAFCEGGHAPLPVFARPTEGGSDVECCSFSTRVPGVVDGLSKLFFPERMPGLRQIDVPATRALATTRQLIERGFAVGPSSGLNYAAASDIAAELSPSAHVVTVFADRMERYFSTELAGLGEP